VSTHLRGKNRHTQGTLQSHGPHPCRNGPGLFTVGGQELAHPFDGHGLVVSIAFRGGRAYLRSRFVRTQECAAPPEPHPPALPAMCGGLALSLLGSEAAAALKRLAQCRDSAGHGSPKLSLEQSRVLHERHAQYQRDPASKEGGGVWGSRCGRSGSRYCDEERAGRVLYRGTFGTPLAGGWLANALDVAVGRPGALTVPAPCYCVPRHS